MKNYAHSFFKHLKTNQYLNKEIYFNITLIQISNQTHSIG